MQRTVACWLVAFGAWSTAAMGQRQITEQQFLSSLGPDHPAVAEARAELGRARAERLRGSVAEDPTISFINEDLGEVGKETTLFLAWRPPLDGRRGAAVEAGDAAVQAAELRLETNLLAARSAMRAEFADWAQAIARRDVVARHVESLDGIVGTIEARAESGEASRLAAARIRLSAVEVRTLLGALEAAVAEAVAAVRVWDASIAMADRPVAPKLPDAPGTQTLDGRTDLQAMRLDIERAMAAERRGSRFIEFPELIAGWKELEAGEGSFDGAVLGLNWRLPLGERGRGERLEAGADREAATAALVIARARAEADLSGSVRAYVALVDSWRRSAADLAETDWMIEAAFSRYRAGEAELTDLLDTLRSVLAARLASEELYGRALGAHRRMEEVVGRPLVAGGAG
jgi:cobalt-zinc-cadmium efflux system outer membrane protein